MDSALGFEIAIGIVALDLDRSGGNPCFIGFLIIGGGHGESAIFRPALIHSEKHSGPVASLRPACSSLDNDVSIADIRGTIEKGDNLEFFDVGGERRVPGVGFLCGIEVIEFFSELDVREEVFDI